MDLVTAEETLAKHVPVRTGREDGTTYLNLCKWCGDIHPCQPWLTAHQTKRDALGHETRVFLPVYDETRADRISNNVIPATSHRWQTAW